MAGLESKRVVSEQRVYSSVHGEGRGGSGRGHAEKVAAVEESSL